MRPRRLFLCLVIGLWAAVPRPARGEPSDRMDRLKHRAMDEEVDRWNRRRDEAVEAEVMKLMTWRKQAIEEAAGGLGREKGKEQFFFTQNHPAGRGLPLALRPRTG